MIPQFVISTIAVIIVVLIAAYGFTTRGYFVHLVLVSAPFLVYLVNHPAVWLMVVVALSRSGLIFPGLPQGLQVVHVLMAGLVALLLARLGIDKFHARPRRGAHDFFLLAFLGVILLTAYVRGFGIRALGDANWGGMSYIKLLVAGAFLFLSPMLTLTERQFKKALYFMLVFSLLPAIAQIIFLLSGGSVYHQYMFVEAYVGGLLSSLEALERGGAVRLHMMGHVASTMLMIGSILLSRATLVSRAAFAVVVVLSLAFAALSGFRASLVYIGAVLLMLQVMGDGHIRIRRALPLLLAGLLFLPVAYLAAPVLPAAVQRTFSILPGIDIPYHIRYEAMMSTLTRMQVWEMALDEIPRYLFIGKGFTVNPADLLSPSVRANWVLSAFLGHNYHSGPISLLLDTGIFGFLFGTLFLISSSMFFLRRIGETKGHPLMQRAYVFLLAHHLYSVVSYYVIFGDVRESFPALFVNATMLHAILASVRAQRAAPPLPRRRSIAFNS